MPFHLLSLRDLRRYLPHQNRLSARASSERLSLPCAEMSSNSQQVVRPISGVGGLSSGDLAFWFSAVLFDENVNDQKPLPDNVFASRRSVRWWYQLFVC